MQKTTSRDGTTIAYDRTGEGSPVVLVGGAFSERGHPVMSGLAALLSTDFTVYNYDRRGRGDSGDQDSYEVAAEVDDLRAILDAAGGSAAVFGLSSGGALALEAAAGGLEVTKVAVYDPPYVDGDENRPRPSAEFAAELESLASAGKRGEAVELFLTKGMGMPPQFVEPMRQMPMWPGLEALAHTLPYDVTIAGDGSVPTDRFASVAVPTLVLDGAEAPSAATPVIAGAIDGARSSSLPGASHEVTPEQLAPALKEFFAS